MSAIFTTGVGELQRKFSEARDEIPGAVNWALARAADEIRDKARSNVPGSQYNLSHDMWGIKSRMAKRWAYTSEIGYFTTRDDGAWHIKFYESGATRSHRGTIFGGHFLKTASGDSKEVAYQYMRDAIDYALRKAKLADS